MARHAGRRSGYVTLPLLGPTLRVSVFLSMIGALQLFDIIWVTTGGGPGQRLEHDGDLHDRLGLQAVPAGLRQRGRRHPVRRGLIVALAYQRFVMRRDIDGAMTAGGG